MCGSSSRCACLQVINTLAAQIVLNNQDRCTKNFLLYLPPRTAQWLM